jgi:hypothetical protein
MADVLKLDNSSRENLENFVDSIGEDAIRDLLRDQLDHIIAVGRLDHKNSNREQHQNAFFDAVKRLIEEKVKNCED